MRQKSALIVSFIILVVAVVAIIGVIVRRQQSQTINSNAAGISKSKLGIFIQGNNADAQKIVNSGPAVIKILVSNPNAMYKEDGTYNEIIKIAKDYKAKFPSGKVLIRFYFNEMGQTTLTDSIPADDAAETVFEQYEPILKKLRDKGDMKYFDYIAGPTNETERVPFWSKSTNNMYWLARFWDTLTKLNSYAGIKTCAGNILTGDLPLGSEMAKTLKAGLIPTLNSTGGVFCYHGYSDTGFSKDAAGQEEQALEYRRFYRDLGVTTPKMIIGELGIADGWKKAGTPAQYQDWLTWYDSEIKKDSQIIGSTIYQVGGGGNDAIDGAVSTWLASYLGGSSTPPPPPPPPPANQACYDSCFKKSGNGSGCRFICDNGKEACFNTCVNSGTAAKTCISQCSGTVPPPPPPPGNQGTWIEFDDKNPKFIFESGPTRKAAGYTTWDLVSNGGDYVLRGGTARQCNGLNSVGCFATLGLTTETFNFDSFKIGFSSGPNRTEADIFVDGKKIGAADSFSSSNILNYNSYKLWTSPTNSFGCGKHTIQIFPNQKTGTGQKAFTLDFLDVHTCTTTTPPPPTIPPPTTPTTTQKCQGNRDASAKCFSCRKDSPDDQINIFDFSCFSNQFGKSVGGI